MLRHARCRAGSPGERQLKHTLSSQNPGCAAEAADCPRTEQVLFSLAMLDFLTKRGDRLNVECDAGVVVEGDRCRALPQSTFAPPRVCKGCLTILIKSFTSTQCATA